MADGFKTPFKDAVVPQASGEVKPTLGADATGKPQGAEVTASVPPITFPAATLKSISK